MLYEVITDGILAGLYFLDLMVKLNKTPSELLKLLFSVVGEHFYDRIDSPFSGDRKQKEENIINAKPEKIGGLKVMGLNSTDRITSYNVCYTKLLRTVQLFISHFNIVLGKFINQTHCWVGIS